MTKRKTTKIEPYLYKLSGLKDVGLVGIEVMKCSECEDERPIIPRIAQLHGLIALELIKKPGLLRGDELRFLRKQASLPQGEFAALIEVSQEHLSRVENGHTETLSEARDRLARAIVATIAKDGEAAREVLLNLGQKKMKRQDNTLKQKQLSFNFTSKDGQWERAASARKVAA
jgi:DNA-binding transcriptional regulator YiaG